MIEKLGGVNDMRVVRKVVKPQFRHWLGLVVGGFGLLGAIQAGDHNYFVQAVVSAGILAGVICAKRAYFDGGQHLLWILPSCLFTSQVHYLIAGGMPHHNSFSSALIHGAILAFVLVFIFWVIVRSARRVFTWVLRRIHALRRRGRLQKLARENPRTLQSDQSEQYLSMDEVIVTLVHGTFAKNAPWTAPGSMLYEGIRRSLGSGGILQAFHWSGENSHDDRIAAGNALASQLLGQSIASPSKRHLIVAHSHGGNVALYALKSNPELATVTAGIVTMATPFLSVQRRAIWEGLNLMSWIVPPLLTLVCFVSMIFLSHHFQWWILLLLGFLFVLGMAFWGGKRLKRWILGPVAMRMVEQQRHIIERLNPVPQLQVPLLYAFVSYDEAGLLLRILHFIGSAGHQVLGLLFRLLRIGFLTFVAIDIATEFGDKSLNDRSHLSTIFGAAGMNALITIAFIYCVCLIGAAAWPWLVRGHRFGFGKESLWTNFLVDIGATVQPPACVKGEPCTVHVQRFNGLRHSYLYNSEEFLEKLVNWITHSRTQLYVHQPSVGQRSRMVTEYLLAGGLVLAFLVSILPVAEKDLQAAIAPTGFDQLYPLTVPKVENRLFVLQGQHESKLAAPLKLAIQPTSNSCRLVGYIHAKDTVNFRLMHGDYEHSTMKIHGFTAVDIEIGAIGEYELQLIALSLGYSKMMIELELVCGRFN